MVLWLGAAALAAPLFLSASVQPRTPVHHTLVGPAPARLITYCLTEANNTEAFAKARDDGMTAQEMKERIAQVIADRNANELVGDDVPSVVLAILFSNIEFAHAHPTWSADQIWDGVYRGCIRDAT